MATYLLIWNPDRWQWYDIEDDIAQINESGICKARWSCGSTKKIIPNDRVFLMKLGHQKPRGIMASGWVNSNVFQDIHWGDESKLANYVYVHFDTLIDPVKDAILPIEFLKEHVSSKIIWTPQASGMTIPTNVAERLEVEWARFLDRPSPVRQIYYADEIEETRNFYEGITKQVKVNSFERSLEARAICINHYGSSCSVCGFDFGKRFGKIGMGFIHVHHIKPLSEIRKGYYLNPINDLRPVCPNCHAMIHQKKPEPYTIEELKAILSSVCER